MISAYRGPPPALAIANGPLKGSKADLTVLAKTDDSEITHEQFKVLLFSY